MNNKHQELRKHIQKIFSEIHLSQMSDSPSTFNYKDQVTFFPQEPEDVPDTVQIGEDEQIDKEI